MYRKFDDHKAASAWIYEDEKEVSLISYTTRVVTMKKGKDRKVECTGTYSATTRKHIGWFVREFMPDLSYYSMKEIAGKGFVAI